MDSDIKQYVTAKQTWSRGLFIVLFAVIYSIAEIVLFTVVLFQFLSMLFTGETNDRLLKFGQSLSTYVYQILQFMTANSEEHPYPFNPWPAGPPPRDKDQEHQPDKPVAADEPGQE